jgi:hypothetical protein
MAADNTLQIPQQFEYFSSHAEAGAAERAYWFSRTPRERLAAAEKLRQAVYGYDPDSAIVSPVFEYAEPRGR